MVKTLRSLTARELEPGLRGVAPGERRAVRAPGDRRAPYVLAEARPRVREVENAETLDAPPGSSSVRYATRLPTRGAQSRQLVSSRGSSSIRPERRSMARSSQPSGAGEGDETDAAPPGSLPRLTLICRGGRCLTVLRLLGRRRRRLTLIRRRGSAPPDRPAAPRPSPGREARL